jgi:MOSC domain-containing protein YiiM
MRLVSINVGQPRAVAWRGRSVQTSIWKDPVSGPVYARKLNLDGDRQADLKIHGGADKAVYVYPSEHYAYWAPDLGGVELPWGAFGENFTTEGLLEGDVRIGDQFTIGGAQFAVTQPRMPCFKLGIRFGRPDFRKTLLQSGRTGFYVAVVREGMVAADDAIQRSRSEKSGLTVSEIVSVYRQDADNQDLLRRASELAALPDSWRDYFKKRLSEPDA